MRLFNSLIGVACASSVSNGEVNVVGQVEKDVAYITSCNDSNDKIAINVAVDSAYFDGGSSWTLKGDDWVKEFPLEELTNMGVVQNQLVMETTINLDHDGSQFFADGDYSLSFKCYYSLDEQILDVGTSTTISSFGVQPRNQHHVIARGSLNYKFTLDTPTQEIGHPVQFSIEPLNPGVIYNRVSECLVSKGTDEYYIFGGDIPFCADDFTEFKAISGYGSTGVQRFSYTAFKWGEEVTNGTDQQNIKCKVEFKARPFVDIDLDACDGQIPITTTSTTTRPTVRTTDPSSSEAPVQTTANPLPEITTIPTLPPLPEGEDSWWTIPTISCPDPRFDSNNICKRKKTKQARQKKRKDKQNELKAQIESNKAFRLALRREIKTIKADIKKAG